MAKTRFTCTVGIIGVVLAIPMLLNATRAFAGPRTPITVAQLVLIDNGQQIGTFQKLVGITSPNPALQFVYQSGSGQLVHTKQYGKTRPPQVVLEGGVVTTQVWRWHLSVRAKNPNARQTVILEAFTASGKIPLSFTLHNAWPSRLQITGLKAGNSAIAVTRLTLTCESITRNT